MDHTDTLTAISTYLSRQYAIVPLHNLRDGSCTCGNPKGDPDHDRKQGGKHPLYARWNISGNLINDLQTGLALAAARPDMNIGCATGRVSGFWVLDFDPDSAGDDARALLTQLAAYAPHVRTGSGGLHWRWAMPSDFEPSNSAGRLPAGLDVRGTGGQVVLPPSVSGKGAYVELSDAVPPAAPDWLLALIRPKTPPQRQLPDVAAGSTDALTRRGAAIVAKICADLRGQESGRNNAALAAACDVIEYANSPWNALSRDEVRAEWEAAVYAHPLGVSVPFGEVEELWRNASRRAGDKIKPVPESTMGGEVIPFSLAPMGLSPVSPGADPFTDPGGVVASVPPVDQFEVAVLAELGRMRVREEAKRRAEFAKLGDRAEALARLEAEFLDSAGMDDLPPLRPLVDGALYRNTLARVNGASGAGKTFVMLDLAAAIGGDAPIWGGRRVLEHGEVWYIIGEAPESARRRKQAWERLHGRKMLGVRFFPRPVQALSPEWELLTELAERRKPVLIIGDTQARLTVGVNENDNSEMGEVVAALDALRVASGACVVPVHHHGTNGRARGATGVYGALQTEWTISKPKGVPRISVDVNGKAKDDPDSEPPIAFDLVPVDLEDGGRPAAALRHDPLSDPGTGSVDEAGTGQARSIALYGILRDFYNPGDGGTRAEIRAMFLGCKAMASLAEAPTDSRSKAWRRAWNDLVERGLIARKAGADRFKVIILSDQSDDGVLTRNSGERETAPPTGWVVHEDAPDAR